LQAVFGGVFAGGKLLLEDLLLKRQDNATSVDGKTPQLSTSLSLASSLFAGGIACTVSSPLNYVRNVKYGTASHQQPPTSHAALALLWKEAVESGHTASYLQGQLRVGWGTLRVSVGMAVGYELFEVFKHQLGLLPWK
jgi:hypothetical protein